MGCDVEMIDRVEPAVNSIARAEHDLQLIDILGGGRPDPRDVFAGLEILGSAVRANPSAASIPTMTYSRYELSFATMRSFQSIVPDIQFLEKIDHSTQLYSAVASALGLVIPDDLRVIVEGLHPPDDRVEVRVKRISATDITLAVPQWGTDLLRYPLLSAKKQFRSVADQLEAVPVGEERRFSATMNFRAESTREWAIQLTTFERSREPLLSAKLSDIGLDPEWQRTDAE